MTNTCPVCGQAILCDKQAAGPGAIPTYITTSAGIVMNMPEQIESD